ncbi:ATP-binding cassette domain-containing protein [Companilactobacillus allii]|uniref:ABC-F type ribosomal protection protein n=1 Tax=Companilactobacillus allii TaxID=1847728 RepID=A0A1P8Q095_9LACO|nr:ATP-binding cassette domain-containing protein [Companilactobacillus allii]APX71219.1 ABC-F type ribosomal protection protein [Companilactobacillus allii]USQ68297.1 ATP-binding cassette domain-containing protein [Companilactobacillus allii]
MGTIQIENVSFKYDQMVNNLFDSLNLKIDESWKLGLIGRNGRGKSTLMQMLLGKLQYSGQIISNLNFYYYPQPIVDKNRQTIELVKELTNLEEYDMWKIEVELDKLQVKTAILNQKFSTLSPGEQTKVLLAILFIDDYGFQLIDEPTNHLDIAGRKVVSDYLKSKKGFIVISHDKAFLNQVIDHVISINRTDVDVYKGNYDTWEQEKTRQDQLELGEKNQLKKDINRLHETAVKRENWSRQTEKGKNKTGLQQVNLDKGFIGHKSAKMMKKAKVIVKRVDSEIDEKKNLLKNIEIEDPIELNYVKVDHPKNLITVDNLQLRHDEVLTPKVSFKLPVDTVVSLIGENGIGKTTVFKQILGIKQPFEQIGELHVAANAKISYLAQEDELAGNIRQLAFKKQIDAENIFSNLRKLGFERSLFDQSIENMSQGQKRKVALAISLSEEANIYLWDEPLNFLDVITRQQIIDAIKKQHPTMLLIDHDQDLIDEVSDQKIILQK